nr:unnamed protein product [Callosobruchus chinensis]
MVNNVCHIQFPKFADSNTAVNMHLHISGYVLEVCKDRREKITLGLRFLYSYGCIHSISQINIFLYEMFPFTQQLVSGRQTKCFHESAYGDVFKASAQADKRLRVQCIEIGTQSSNCFEPSTTN